MLRRYFTLVCAFVAGVCVLQCLPWLPPLYPLLFWGGLAVLASQFSPIGKSFILCLAVFLLAMAYANWRASLRLTDQLQPEWEGQLVEAEGYIGDLPQSTRFGCRFLFIPEKILTTGAQLPSHIQSSWYGDPARVHAGERWRLSIKPKRVHGAANPGGFDLESWFLQQGIGATANVSGGQKLPDMATGAWLERIRANLREQIRRALPNAPYAGVIIALTVGDQGSIPPEQWQRFATTGITHLISISGLHITMLAGIAGWISLACWRRVPFLASRYASQRIALLAGLVAALAYSLLAGMAVPTQRTLLMLLIAVFCLWRAKPASVSAIWACALLAVVVLDPFCVLSVGFWLSFLTVGGLLWVGSNRIGALANWQNWIHTQWAATLASAPILLLVFGQLPLISPLANAIAIPVVSLLITPLALAGLLDPSGRLLWAAERLFALSDVFLSWCEHLPLAVLQFSSPPLWTIIPALLGVGLLLSPRGLHGRMLGWVFLLPILVFQPPDIPIGDYRVTVLDVGQGLSVMVETRHSVLLFDTGLPANGERVAIPALRAQGRKQIDWLLLSHNDNDHIGGAAGLLAHWPVREVVHSLPEGTSWLSLAGLQRRCLAGDVWQKDGVTFRLLWPNKGEMGANDNARSCVLLVDNQHQRVLIPADLGGAEEQRLLEQGLPAVDVVIAGHHGGKGSSSQALIDAIHPRFVVFSVGYRNQFGHPRADTLERYRSAGTQILRTDYSGALVFDISQQTRVYCWRARQHYWSWRRTEGIAESCHE